MNNERYAIDFDSLVERLMPTYLRGRLFRRIVKIIVSPLQSVNDWFVKWAHEQEVANKVTSQKILLEQYLTSQLRTYIIDKSDRFEIILRNPYSSNAYVFGIDEQPPSLYEQVYATKFEDRETAAYICYLYSAGFLATSFYVSCPLFDETIIAKDEFEAKVKTIVDRYRLPSKNYKIIYRS